MGSEDDTPEQVRGGLPHSEIPGSPIARISPGLFAACHVLPRLSVPRHPPDALLLRLMPNAAAHRGKTRALPQQGPSPRERRGPICAKRPHMKTLLRTGPLQALLAPLQQAKLRFAERARCRAACPPRSHDNSSSPFNQHPAPRVRAGNRVLLRASAPPRLAPHRRGGASRRSAAAPVGWRSHGFASGGGERIRTDDLLLAKQALSQLSYTPVPEQPMSENRRAEILPFCVLRFCPLGGGPGRI